MNVTKLSALATAAFTREEVISGTHFC